MPALKSFRFFPSFLNCDTGFLNLGKVVLTADTSGQKENMVVFTSLAIALSVGAAAALALLSLSSSLLTAGRGSFFGLGPAAFRSNLLLSSSSASDGLGSLCGSNAAAPTYS
jgi:CxxC motif-containing protein (DUF1111 family)